jgi:hypothetical protein
MILDTNSRALALHNDLYRQIGEIGRARVAAELSDALRDLVDAGVRQRYPEYDDAQVHAEVLRVFYGRRVVQP